MATREYWCDDNSLVYSSCKLVLSGGSSGTFKLREDMSDPAGSMGSMTTSGEWKQTGDEVDLHERSVVHTPGGRTSQIDSHTIAKFEGYELVIGSRRYSPRTA